jgi:maleate isomerase
MKRVGVLFTPDNANDRDCWRWCPLDATLLMARTPLEASWIEEQPSDRAGDPPVWIPTDHEVAEGVRALILAEPDVITYACTSGSFCGPPDNESRIRDVMTDAGAKVAQTTSGALLDALRAIGATSVAVGTPYRGNVTDELGAFLARAGYTVASLIHEDPAPGEADAHLTEESMVDLALRADRADADVVFLSCAALETFDLIPELERRLAKPVLTATQVTMWAALGAASAGTIDAPQSLLSHRWIPG